MKQLLIVVTCLILIGCDSGNERMSKSIRYVRDRNGIVYATGSAGPHGFFFTTVPESETHKIPANSIENLP